MSSSSCSGYRNPRAPRAGGGAGRRNLPNAPAAHRAGLTRRVSYPGCSRPSAQIDPRHAQNLPRPRPAGSPHRRTRASFTVLPRRFIRPTQMRIIGCLMAKGRKSRGTAVGQRGDPLEQRGTPEHQRGTRHCDGGTSAHEGGVPHRNRGTTAYRSLENRVSPAPCSPRTTTKRPTATPARPSRCARWRSTSGGGATSRTKPPSVPLPCTRGGAGGAGFSGPLDRHHVHAAGRSARDVVAPKGNAPGESADVS